MLSHRRDHVVVVRSIQAGRGQHGRLAPMRIELFFEVTDRRVEFRKCVGGAGCRRRASPSCPYMSQGIDQRRFGSLVLGRSRLVGDGRLCSNIGGLQPELTLAALLPRPSVSAARAGVCFTSGIAITVLIASIQVIDDLGRRLRRRRTSAFHPVTYMAGRLPTRGHLRRTVYLASPVSPDGADLPVVDLRFQGGVGLNPAAMSLTDAARRPHVPSRCREIEPPVALTGPST